jgi:osmotically-inducible protein OsmY
MKKISVLKMILFAFSLMMAFNLGVSAQKTDCSKTTNDEIVKAIQGKVSVKYTDQLTHINFSVENGVVSIEGYTTTKKMKKEIEKLVKKVSCVTKIISNLKVGAGGGCGTGSKPCGEICIPSNQTCNIGKQS